MQIKTRFSEIVVLFFSKDFSCRVDVWLSVHTFYRWMIFTAKWNPSSCSCLSQWYWTWSDVRDNEGLGRSCIACPSGLYIFIQSCPTGLFWDLSIQPSIHPFFFSFFLSLISVGYFSSNLCLYKIARVVAQKIRLFLSEAGLYISDSAQKKSLVGKYYVI